MMAFAFYFVLQFEHIAQIEFVVVVVVVQHFVIE